MRKLIIPIVAVLALAVTGCASDSLQRCYQAKSAYASTLETAADLRDAGVISPAQARATKPYRVAAEAALTGWEAAARNGDVNGANSYEQKFKDAAAVIQRLIDAQRPATRPTGAIHGNSGGIIGGEVNSGAGGDGFAGEPGHYARRMAIGQRPDRQCRRAA